MAIAKATKTKAYFKRYQVKYRRRRAGKTDYRARLRLVTQDKNKYNTPKYRFVVRFTRKDIITQVTYATMAGDVVVCAAYAHELPRYGLKAGLTNYAAAYCTGLLCARRMLQKFGMDKEYEGSTEVTGEDYNVEQGEGRAPFKALLDVGLVRTTTGNRVFGALKGACDGGMEIPHSDKRFPGFMNDGKGGSASLDAEVHRKYIFGGHVGEYMEMLEEEEPEKYQSHFAKFLGEGVDASGLEEMYKGVHAAIRADPAAKLTEKKLPAEKRSWKMKKLTYEQRKANLVPKTFTADDLTHVLAEAGTVCDVTIVKDRVTKESRGCAFVLYSTRAEADAAIALFHNIRKLPGAKTAMQVKYADGQEHKIENKLFVGMLPKAVTAEQLTAVFSQYGTVIDINVLKPAPHITRGSAFVKFQSYAQAQAAIDALNGKHRLEEGGVPMAVKWADTDKEKMARKAHRMGPPAPAAAALGMGPSPPGLYSSPLMGSAPGAAFFLPPSTAPSLYGSPMQPQLQQYGGMDLASLYQPQPPAMPQPQPHDMYAMPPPATQHYHTDGAAAAMAGGGGGGGGGGGIGGPVGGYQLGAVPSATAVAAAVRQALAQKEGPPGANIFVYNIPPEWRDHDLTTAFVEFGNVLSARVFIDKNTGLSKNFGFVSYDAAEAAQAAIAVMDGFLVGGRHLKVSVKKGQQASAPGHASAPY
ncbi:unnamed protein product [Closterium sp. Naga37s-1]|nr:unnamed protein product [Closterium sp. Naga37s-1]